MAYEERLLRRYLAVHALAEKGATDGERMAAANQRGGLEEKHPGIGIEALRLDAQEKGKAWASSPPRSSPPPTPPRSGASSSDPHFGPYTAAGGNWGTGGQPEPQKARWGNFGDFLGEAWTLARDVTQSVVNAEAGKMFAERVVSIEGNHTAAGNYRLTAVTTIQNLMQAKAALNESQKQAFAKAVGEMVAAQVYTLISPAQTHDP